MFDTWSVPVGENQNIIYSVDDPFDGKWKYRVKAHVEGTDVFYLDVASSSERKKVEHRFRDLADAVKARGERKGHGLPLGLKWPELPFDGILASISAAMQRRMSA